MSNHLLLCVVHFKNCPLGRLFMGPHIQVTCLFKALVFAQLYQSHSLTAIGLKSGKTSITWVSVGISDTLKLH